MTEKWTLVNYFDVWGNQEDGYEVNNLCTEGEIELSDNPTKEEIVSALIAFGFFNESVTPDMIELPHGIDSHTEIVESATGRPICRLENKSF